MYTNKHITSHEKNFVQGYRAMYVMDHSIQQIEP